MSMADIPKLADVIKYRSYVHIPATSTAFDTAYSAPLYLIVKSLTYQRSKLKIGIKQNDKRHSVHL